MSEQFDFWVQLILRIWNCNGEKVVSVILLTAVMSTGLKNLVF